jgi:uncharacterized protein
VKLSREKILRLSHLILDHLNKDEEIEYFADPQEIRGEIVKMISDEMKADEAIDALVRRKIESQKRTIQEGSDEWDVLYRKYYEEEVGRHRRVMP